MEQKAAAIPAFLCLFLQCFRPEEFFLPLFPLGSRGGTILKKIMTG
jgi:hypothetical protein